MTGRCAIAVSAVAGLRKELRVSSVLSRAASAAALCALLALLMADSADPACDVVPFDRTYEITSSCPEYGTETIRVRLEGGTSSHQVPAEIERIAGDDVVTEVRIDGECGEAGEPASYVLLSLTLSEVGGGGTLLYCDIELDTLDSGCFESDCTLAVREVEARR